MILHCTVCTIHAGGHHQDTKVRVNIKVKDVNDNPPEFATNNEVLMCETVAPGKVRLSVWDDKFFLKMYVFGGMMVKLNVSRNSIYIHLFPSNSILICLY